MFHFLCILFYLLEILKYMSIIKKARKCIVLFTIGGIGYAFVEIMWRGRTHWSMVIAGGVCFVIFELIARSLRPLPLIIKAFIGAISVTLVELLFGIIFNLMLGMNVWDYSGEWCNLFGQICPLFSLLWVALALPFIPCAGFFGNFLSSKN